ncbi:hypothetical protein [Parapedobacter sp. 2B3]|uniref:hypothetical protein n=1 Tax=Parapedobacter sp. 2B3 TaxID=3342381 RepID=UPI0035B5D92E
MDIFHIKLIFFVALVIGSVKAYPFLLKKVNEPGTSETSIWDKILLGIGTCTLFMAFFGLLQIGYIFVEGLQTIDKDPSSLYNRWLWGDILIWTSIYVFTFATVLWVKSKISELIVKSYNKAITRAASDFADHFAKENLLNDEERDRTFMDFLKRHMLDETQTYNSLKELDDSSFMRKNLASVSDPKFFD